MKTCTSCGKLKDDSEFWLVRERGKTRRRARCRECCKADVRDRSGDPRPDSKECTHCGKRKPLAAFRNHKICRYGVESICKECKDWKRKVRVASDPEDAKSVDLKATYGITLADYRAMHARQQGRCAICGTAEGKLVVDHHHGTGRVRSLPCHLCNTMLGCAREREDILVRAIAYLRVVATVEAEG